MPESTEKSLYKSNLVSLRIVSGPYRTLRQDRVTWAMRSATVDAAPQRVRQIGRRRQGDDVKASVGGCAGCSLTRW
jgi:hypothetical protein